MPERDSRPEPGGLPEVRRLPPTAALGWLAAGWRDFRRAPLHALTYGLTLVAVSYFITAVTYLTGNLVLLAALLSGFLLVAPVLPLALYDISRQLQRGAPPSYRRGLQAIRGNLGNQVIFAVVLLVILLVWARAAAMVHVFFPAVAQPGAAELAGFLAVGTAVGAVFAFLVFGAAAFSLPLMVDRDMDVITAVITSFIAVNRNKAAMVVWAGLIVALVGLGFATAFFGLAVVLPVTAFATWHAYQETIGPGGGRTTED